MKPNSTANIRRLLELENHPTFSAATYQPDSENGAELRFKQAFSAWCPDDEQPFHNPGKGRVADDPFLCACLRRPPALSIPVAWAGLP